MNQRAITVGITSFVLIVGSIFLGLSIGQGQSNLETPLAAVAILIVALLVVTMGNRIWLLIPVFLSWNGQIPILPLPFSVLNLVILLVLAVWLLSMATRKQKWGYRPDAMDVVIVLTAALLAVGYARNPVGVAAFAGGSNVGGRPYVEVAISLMAYLLLAGQQVKAGPLAGLPKWSVISGGVVAVGGAIAFLLPQVGILLYQFYNGFTPNVGELFDPYGTQTGIGQFAFVRPLSWALAAFVGAKCAPTHLLKPENSWLLGLLAFATLLALASGFRSSLVTVAFYVICSSWLWLRTLGLILSALAAVLFLALIVAAQSVVPLPDTIQRSLSFLPGPWDERVVRAGEDSTEWRLEIWEDVLKGDSVKNWWIGDGFGYPRAELEYFGFLAKSGQIRPDQLAEYYTITGDLHSGPLSAAKYAGVVGAVLYLILAIMIFRRYSKVWRKLYRYPQLSFLLFVVGFYSIISFYIPIRFLFVAGFYNQDLPTLLISAGLCRLICRVAQDAMDEEDAEFAQEFHDRPA